MQAVRKINNNAAVCVDGKGRELVALGKGIGFGALPREVPLSDITRTFYDMDPKYLDLIGEMSQEVLEFSAQLADICRAMISYELSPALPITLADHISFMLERARKHMVVQMPLAYEVQQSHPLEFRLGELAVRNAKKTFKVRLDRNEACGIALSIANSAITKSDRTTQKDADVQFLLEGITGIVEDEMGIVVDRDSFDYARFATHVRYLIDRVLADSPITTPNSTLFDQIVTEYPKAATCANRASKLVEDRLQRHSLSNEERLYLLLHVNRISERTTARG